MKKQTKESCVLSISGQTWVYPPEVHATGHTLVPIDCHGDVTTPSSPQHLTVQLSGGTVNTRGTHPQQLAAAGGLVELDVKNNPSSVTASAGEVHNMPLPKEPPLEMFAGESETAYNQKLNQNHLNRSSFNRMESAVVGFIRNRYDR